LTSRFFLGTPDMKLVAAKLNSIALPETVGAVLDTVSQDFLRDVVARISVPRPTGIPQNEAVRRVIVDLFSGTQGVEVDEAGNVVVSDPRRARMLIGAHYDSIPGTPGADDNASGVAALVAAARALGPREGVRYVAFDGEECGFVGSRALVAGLGRHRPEQVHVLEMVGYTSREAGSQRNPVPLIQAPNVGDFLGLVGTYRSGPILDHVLATAACHPVPVQGLYLPDVPLERIGRISHHLLRSDHAPFWRAGLHAGDARLRVPGRGHGAPGPCGAVRPRRGRAPTLRSPLIHPTPTPDSPWDPEMGAGGLVRPGASLVEALRSC
jgi:Peptidase family M28